MKYGNLTNDVLDQVVEDSYDKGDITLRERLKDWNEDIEHATWYFEPTDNRLAALTIWTQNYVIWLQGYGPFDGIHSIPRNPVKKAPSDLKIVVDNS